MNANVKRIRESVIQDVSNGFTLTAETSDKGKRQYWLRKGDEAKQLNNMIASSIIAADFELLVAMPGKATYIRKGTGPALPKQALKPLAIVPYAPPMEWRLPDTTEPGDGLPETPDSCADVGTWDTPDTQLGLFGDTKSLRQRKAKPQQLEMFTARDLVQYTHANPVLPDRVKMVLSVQEARTPEEIEADKLRQANSQTKSLF